jgi:putative peptidoglycan lipid II flippase
MISSGPLIAGLLQFGAFTAEDTAATALALSAFSLGLPAYVLIKVLTPGFYARSDTKTPVRIALLAMLVNLIGNLALIGPFGHVGLALSTALSAWVNVGLLYWTLRRRDISRPTPRSATASSGWRWRRWRWARCWSGSTRSSIPTPPAASANA